MDVTAIDYVLLAVIGTLAIIGLFKGLSGWLGTLTGAASATVFGYFGFGYCLKAATACPWVSGPFVSLAAAILDFLVGLIVFGLARRLAVKFFSFLLPQPLNAIVGMVGGLLLGLVLLVLPFQNGRYPSASLSKIVLIAVQNGLPFKFPPYSTSAATPDEPATSLLSLTRRCCRRRFSLVPVP